MDTEVSTEVEAKEVDSKFRGRKEALANEKAIKEFIKVLSKLNYDELEVTNAEIIAFISNPMYDVIKEWKKNKVSEERGSELNAWEIRANNANKALTALDKVFRKFRKYLKENKRTNVDDIFVYIGELCTIVDDWEAESPQKKRRKRKKLTQS